MSEYVLHTNSLTKNFKKQVALNKVNLSIKKGSIYGFIGQNGAGKSTLIRIVSGLANPTTGSIELFGHSNERELIRSEEHTSELQSRGHLVCRLLLEKKKKRNILHSHIYDTLRYDQRNVGG